MLYNILPKHESASAAVSKGVGIEVLGDHNLAGAALRFALEEVRHLLLVEAAQRPGGLVEKDLCAELQMYLNTI